MKYEHIYNEMKLSIEKLNVQIEDMKDPYKSHKMWLKLEKIQETIQILRDLLYSFQANIVRDGNESI